MMSRWLLKATSQLENAGIQTARLDCLVLLEDVTGKERSWLLAHPEFELSKTSVKKLDGQITRRAHHEPLAYIRGKSEFYGREFLVNSHTLEPRPETETIIDLVKTIVKSHENPVIVDVGTGSGCIAISVKLALPRAEVLATDIDVKCVKIACENSKKLGAEVTYLHGNLLEPLLNLKYQISPIFAILANLPYVPDRYQLNKAAEYEPKRAIFGGQDGLDLYRELFAQLSARSQKPQYVLTESLPLQFELLTVIAEEAGYELARTDGFIQVFTS